eukprot:TRINITY_DN5196_c0_g1_i1.p1 TRINITY_DN5196_c0_g1~~TRINITY_DN5196_c0_g1_i1.p1  ORF type:complete len:518 (-),score=164.85 TRINITY_DN5196_c0_g1_i1:25-1578(-)
MDDYDISNYDPLTNTVSNEFASDYRRPVGKLQFLIIFFFFPALGGLLFGLDIGGVSSAFNGNGAYEGNNLANTFDMSNTTQEFAVSSSLIGADIGSLIVFGGGDYLSRRGVLIMASGFYCGGAIMTGASTLVAIVFLGRIFYGIGIGFAMHSAPLYIAEITPAKYRGLFISAKECFIVTGILAGYVMGYIFNGVDYGWRWIFFLMAIPAVAMGIGSYFIPASPRWLSLVGLKQSNVYIRDYYLGEGLDSLSKIRKLSTAEVQQEFNEIENNLTEQLQETFEYKDFFKQSWLLRGLFIGCGLVTLQQISGQPSVLYYASTVFGNAGFSSGAAAALATIGVGVVKLIMTLFSTALVDRAGRRIMLSIGISVMCVALTLLTIASIIQDPENEGGVVSWITIIAMFCYVSGYQLGFGPISWLIISEIFPLKIRSRALSIAVICNFTSNFIVSVSFLSLIELIGSAGSYFLYLIISIVALAFVIFFVPETKGKSLEEIEYILKRKNWFVFDVRKFKFNFNKS